MIVKLLPEHYLEFLSWKDGCTGLSESTLVTMPHYWKSYIMALIRQLMRLRYVSHMQTAKGLEVSPDPLLPEYTQVDACADPENFFRGVQFWELFFVNEWIQIPLKYRADDGPTLNAGLEALWFFRGSGPVLLKKKLYFCEDSVGGGGVRAPCPPSGSAVPIWLD